MKVIDGYFVLNEPPEPPKQEVVNCSECKTGNLIIKGKPCKRCKDLRKVCL